MDRFRIGFVKVSVWGMIALFVLMTAWAGETRRKRIAAETPDAAAETRISAESASEEGVSVRSGCEIIQTMGFTRCGHSVTRRVAAPSGVIGANFSETQAYYSLWHIESFSPDQVTMTREIDLFCPMHAVLSVNEAGEIVLTHNVYGDGMAVDKTYPKSIGDFDEDTQRKLLLGIGFDSPEDAEAWLGPH